MSAADLAAAQHWCGMYAALNATEGAQYADTMLTEFNRRGAVLGDIAAAHCERHGKCLECGHRWPCLTYRMATNGRGRDDHR
jgi:hypothetical protein